LRWRFARVYDRRLVAAASGPSKGDQKDQGDERKRRRGLPPQVIATLVGVTLSAWLIPAFTRQWEDRQKARELKAAITDEIAAATSRTLNAGLDVGKAQQSKTRGRLYDAAGDYWEPASLKIAMKVRAYFSPEVAAGWDAFAFDVRRYLLSPRTPRRPGDRGTRA